MIEKKEVQSKPARGPANAPPVPGPRPRGPATVQVIEKTPNSPVLKQNIENTHEQLDSENDESTPVSKPVEHTFTSNVNELQKVDHDDDYDH